MQYTALGFTSLFSNFMTYLFSGNKLFLISCFENFFTLALPYLSKVAFDT